ncbi:MAG: globin [Microbacteriaceae bacterium BACL28 MAG-120531-bin53]|uniref:globin n=1 Tax=Aquiluna sp. TaxID=2053504 RepID=UPI000714D95F|nr:MAG: globin [Microbacteriaceae bacterium BACL28 MAG-120531-bin53]
MQDFYERVGGQPVFEELTRTFYKGVATDPILKPMYPEEDLEPARVRLQLFLEQYWGGPTTYQETRGHPRLRMRHSVFKINPAAKEAWLMHMEHAVKELSISELDRDELWDYLERAAHSMLNTFED